jgi:hypothetical protein
MKQLLNWFRRGIGERFDRELRYHIDRRVSDPGLSGQRAGSPEASHAELGGVTRSSEEVRDVWLSRWLWTSRMTSASPHGPFYAARHHRHHGVHWLLGTNHRDLLPGQPSGPAGAAGPPT